MGYETRCRVKVDDGTGAIRQAADAAVLIETDDLVVRGPARLAEVPKRLIDKLDVATNAKVWTLGIDDDTLMTQLRERTASASAGRSATSCDVVFVGVETERDLARIDRAAKAIVDTGAIWVVHRKGKTGVADTTIFGRATALGLTYTKVARISETHTAEKLMIPVAQRRRLC